MSENKTEGLLHYLNVMSLLLSQSSWELVCFRILIIALSDQFVNRRILDILVQMGIDHNTIQGKLDRDDLLLQFLFCCVLHSLSNHAVRSQCGGAFVDLFGDLEEFLRPLLCAVLRIPCFLLLNPDTI